ncbi:DUF488 domain-containing protein [Teredinibacter sp. KSP-S5-2]|uniref:DUF488 domain-containing protein n=1 Tax=Teredinibacter sp. KSP-S5-2 TaxID=3034506 RepID=UPI0029341B54|nr:DUF488 domain-containing protein [Teredinibacter sp. KSP-S5-2]WNO07786.1 DUF488 domain-containing protein [Teredinibacter sp. KSP-S5-2]
MTTSPQLYTIGYATKPLTSFIAQLKQYNINAVADVRSVPYSKIFHDYHKENIAAELKKHAIRYVYLGDELGPRSKDETHYDECGQVQFDRLMMSDLFKQGLERLSAGVEKQFNIALMCAEKDPATCHRSLLIGYYLAHHLQKNNPELTLPTQLLHIDHNGEIETQNDLEDRVSQLNSQHKDLFMSEEEAKYEAYKMQLRKTSFINEELKKSKPL